MEKLEYHLQVFDGPLDLLLALIAKNKLDIYDIPIAELLDQYLEQIALMREADMDVASEFLEMAARLVQIKAASLLPQHEQDEEDPRAELTGQLLEYDQCKKAAAQLAARCSFDRLTRPPEPIPADYTYQRIHDPREIAQALVSAWGKGRSLLPPKPESFSALVSRKIVSVASQAIAILRQLWKKKSLPYRALFAGKRDRSQRVAAFLAVLERLRSDISRRGETTLNQEELMGKTEAILFAGGEPVSLDRIAQVLGVRTPVIDSIVSALQEKYNTPSSGIQLMRLGDSAQFCTNPAYVEPVREVLDLKRGTPLSQAAMEVLAVVAYNQPVTKAFVEQVRGVDCSGVLSSLMQKDLLEERGRLELPGRPLLYGTTETFLRCFQLSSIEDLPPPPQRGEEGLPEEEGQLTF